MPPGCCGGSLRAASAVDPRRLRPCRHAIDVVGAEGQRDLRKLGPVPLPVHLDVVDRHQQARQRHQVHVVVPGRRCEAARLARQRREHVDGRMRLNERRHSRQQRRTVGLGRTVHREPGDGQPDGCRRIDRRCRATRSASTGASATAARPGLLERGQPGDSGFLVTRDQPRCRPSENAVTGTAPAAATTADTAATACEGRQVCPTIRISPGLPSHAARPASRVLEGDIGDAHEGHLRAVAAPANLVGRHAETEQVARVEQAPHARGPSATRRQAGAPAVAQLKSSSSYRTCVVGRNFSSPLRSVRGDSATAPTPSDR